MANRASHFRGGVALAASIDGNQTLAANRTLAVTTADKLTVGGKIVPQRVIATFSLPGALPATAGNHGVIFFIADAACELYASTCTLSRLDHLLTHANGDAGRHRRDIAAGRYFMKLADRRIRRKLAELNSNDDADTTATANAVLEEM